MVNPLIWHDVLPAELIQQAKGLSVWQLKMDQSNEYVWALSHYSYHPANRKKNSLSSLNK